MERMQAKCKGLSKAVRVPKAQKRPPAPPLAELAAGYEDRNQRVVAAYATGEYRYQQIAELYGLHFTPIGKILRKARGACNAPGMDSRASNLDLTLLVLYPPPTFARRLLRTLGSDRIYSHP